MIELTAYRGDSMSFTIPLTNGAAAFTPGGSYSLIFTAKRSSKDPDTAAVFQKSTATGTITTSTTNAIVTVLYTDTTNEDEPVLYWDIQAQHNSTAAVITAAKGTLTLVRDITRQTTVSVPIYTVDPGAGGGATPAGTTGSVQINNAGALGADSGLVFTGTGNTGVLKVGGGQIAINALPYSGGGTLTSNIGIGFNPFTPTSNATLSNNVQGNIGIGDNALDSLNSATGYNTNNIAIGTFALSSLNTCQSSVFIGTYAGMFLTADSNSSTIIGDAAGVYYGTGYLSLTQAAGCTFLGRLTKGSAAVSSNQIVIGSSAIGDQDNSTVIGNTNTTQTRLAGNTLKLGSSTLNTSIAQTATGSSKTITLPNASGTVALTDVGQTFSEQQQFSTRPTSSAAGTPAATSLITRSDAVDEIIFNMARIQRSDYAQSYTANGGTSSLNDGDNLSTGTAANNRPVCIRYRQINRFGSGGNVAVCPIRIASYGGYNHSATFNPDSRIRCGIGMALGASIPAANANALAGRGFGWEIYWDGTNIVFGLFAHDGTTYVTTDGTGGRSAAIATGQNPVFYDGFFHIIVGLSAGLVSAWTVFTNNPVAPMRVSGTPTLTLAGGPTTGNNFATSGVQWACVNHSTNTATGSTSIKVLDRLLIMD
jgi:hypothetical protein